MNVTRFDIGHLDQVAEHVRAFVACNLMQFAQHLADVSDGFLVLQTRTLRIHD